MKHTQPLLIGFFLICAVSRLVQPAFPLPPERFLPPPGKTLQFAAVAPLLQEAQKAAQLGKFDEARIRFLKAKALDPNLPLPAWFSAPEQGPSPRMGTLDRDTVLAAFTASPSRASLGALNELIARAPADREVRIALRTIAEMEGDNAQMARHDSILHPRQHSLEKPTIEWLGIPLGLLLIGLIVWQAKALIHDLYKK